MSTFYPTHSVAALRDDLGIVPYRADGAPFIELGINFKECMERPACRSEGLQNVSCVVVPHSKLVSPLICQGFALPASLLWYSCHWQLCIIRFAARRTAPREGFYTKNRLAKAKRFSLCWHYLSSRQVTLQVLSAQTSLTSVFGMGTGGPSPQSIPTCFPIYPEN